MKLVKTITAPSGAEYAVFRHSKLYVVKYGKHTAGDVRTLAEIPAIVDQYERFRAAAAALPRRHFTCTDNMPWSGRDGLSGVHVIEAEYVVVAFGTHWVHYEAVRTIRNEGAPPENARGPTQAGGAARFYWDDGGFMKARSFRWIDYTARYYDALRDANEMMMHADGLEPTSALKQAASDRGIPYGDEMAKFVKWASDQWGLE